MKRLGAWAFALVFTLPTPTAAADVDLHAYWDQRCASCHGHSGGFARRFLRVEGGRLIGTHHRNDLAVFLRNHYLSDELLGPVSAMLTAQVTSPPLFSDKCSGCHGRAADFARKSLVIRDGVLVGSSSGRKVSDYLASHGGLGPAEVPIVVDNLTRVRIEVGNPGR